MKSKKLILYISLLTTFIAFKILDQIYAVYLVLMNYDIIVIWRFRIWCTQLFVCDQLVKINFPKLAANTIALFGMCRYSDRPYDA